MKINFKLGVLPKLALLLATLIWGSSFVMMKNTVAEIPVNLLLAIRFTGAFAFLSLIFIKKWKSINKSYIISGVAMGVCLYLAYCCQTYGLTTTTPGKNAFLTSVYCVIVPFLFWAADKNRPKIDNIFAAFLCVLGIGFVSLTESFVIQIGDALTLAGGFMYAAHIVVIAKSGKKLDPILLTIIQFGTSAVLSWSASLIFEGGDISFAQVFSSTDVIFSLLYLSIMCTAVGLLLQTAGQKHTHPSAASIILSLEGVFGVVFSVILYNEEMTLKLVFGFVLIFISVLISEVKPLAKIRAKKIAD
jgi:Permeases of the drug/metabolite transporter (DMT) superfamily